MASFTYWCAHCNMRQDAPPGGTLNTGKHPFLAGKKVFVYFYSRLGILRPRSLQPWSSFPVLSNPRDRHFWAPVLPQFCRKSLIPIQLVPQRAACHAILRTDKRPELRLEVSGALSKTIQGPKPDLFQFLQVSGPGPSSCLMLSSVVWTPYTYKL